MEDHPRQSFQDLLVGKYLVHGFPYMEYEGKLPGKGQFQVYLKEVVLDGLGIPKGRVVQIKSGFPNPLDPLFHSQGFHEVEEGSKPGYDYTVLFCSYSRKLGMEGKTQEYPRRPIPLGIPGKFLMAGKILAVPGTGRQDNPQPPPFLFRLGSLF
jgi:hypothetical protein